MPSLYLSVIFIFTFASPWVLCSAHDAWLALCHSTRTFFQSSSVLPCFLPCARVYDCVLMYIFFQEKPVSVQVECFLCLLSYSLKINLLTLHNCGRDFCTDFPQEFTYF